MATITHHEDIIAWRLATELKERVFELIARPAISGHFKFCDQLSRSSRSAPANIAEGFWRYRLARRAIGITIGWHNYLMECPDKQPPRLTPGADGCVSGDPTGNRSREPQGAGKDDGAREAKPNLDEPEPRP
jgi:hypothetical protein